ncbi:hypothetical protein GGR55DRAFT_635549 [Xylaria sp. FL0064]|nr:hypothetical protein GGR55DRAFT_635549 [Xylaria sp. FL0064]
MPSYQLSSSNRLFANTGQGLMSFIERHSPSLLVIASQVVAATMNAAAKFCETNLEPVHPFMILHVRMLATGLGCALYLSHVGSSTSVAFFGAKEVRSLVLLRAIGGVCSATGFFCMLILVCLFSVGENRNLIDRLTNQTFVYSQVSMIYLSLSEAIALSFLSPLGSLILARCLSLGTIQWIDYVGGVGALVGVALVAQPEDIFYQSGVGFGASTKSHNHSKGLAFSVFGALGGVLALTSIRHISTRAHPLTSVNVFAWSVVFVSGIALTMIPEVRWPGNPLIWVCLIYIGICGLVMEYLLTAGISKDSSSAATLMMYTQIIFALVVDSVFFHITANGWTFLGTATIIASLCLVTIAGDRQLGYEKAHLINEDHENSGLLDIDENGS